MKKFKLNYTYTLFLAIIVMFTLVALYGYNLLINKTANSFSVYASQNAKADLDLNNKVDIFDLSLLLNAWGSADAKADLNQDGIVNVIDLSIVLSSWGPIVSQSSIQKGAQLPLVYELGSINGNKKFVSPYGNDATGDGSEARPFYSLSKAISLSNSGDNVVLRGGVYRQGSVTVPSGKSLKIIAYPNEIPTFKGSRLISSGWVTEGSLKYTSYNPMPVTNGSGISFTTGQNLTADGIGKYPDQVWVDNTQLRQVSSKTNIREGEFWVDTTNNRLYITSVDESKGQIEASDHRVFLSIYSPNTTIEGLYITRYSNTASDYGVVKVYNTADNNVIKNVSISDTSFIALQYLGDANILNNPSLVNVTITKSNWMGVGALYTDNLLLDKVSITEMNQFDEFTHSPQSGALKTSRTRYTVVSNSDIVNNHSHGLWFDQSNYDVIVANNVIKDNLGSGLFFEISDKLLMINNYVKSQGGARAVKLAGSSGLRVINNTIIGGSDPLGIYTDNRSIVGCSDPSKPLCANSYSSDRDSVRPKVDTIDWMPRIDQMYNNIIAYPSSAGYCGATTTVCITVSNGSALAPIESIIHQANNLRGIPKTYINHNVYANGNGHIFSVPKGYNNLSSLSLYLAGNPVNINDIELNGKFGNIWVNPDGSPTNSLTSLHSEALPLPIDVNINKYLPAGSKHYGTKITY